MILSESHHRKPHKLSRNLSQKAYYLIREKILMGKIPLGAPLSRRGLAQQLGMSFLPVSQAIKRLKQQQSILKCKQITLTGRRSMQS